MLKPVSSVHAISWIFPDDNDALMLMANPPHLLSRHLAGSCLIVH
jgi:hypothetical protein